MQVPTSLWRASCLTFSSPLPRIALLLIFLVIAYSLFPVSPFPAAFSLFKYHPHVSLVPPSPAPLIQNSGSTPLPSSLTSSVGVQFRNASWKSHVGHWLSTCYSNSLSFPIHEPIFNKPCPNQCNSQGICNHADGKCQCPHGYDGLDCTDLLDLECNLKVSQQWPYGRWVVSICSAHCDKRRAFCFCGSGTKYPERPVAEACGFKLNGTMVDWAKPDFDNIFTNESEKNGWCNVDPTDWFNRNVKFKEQCDCKYDCTAGRFCEIATRCVCINQCSGNGVCKGGFCQCREGWYGIDCSIPTPQVAASDLPKWLQLREPSSSQGGESSSVDVSSLQGKTVVVQKKHPLIYVYDLPPTFNSHLLEGRHWKHECVNRVYDHDNTTIWTPQLYGAEVMMIFAQKKGCFFLSIFSSFFCFFLLRGIMVLSSQAKLWSLWR